MVALFSGLNESEDWIENRQFDEVFSAGWHLFAKEQLVEVDEAVSQDVWLLNRTPEAIEKIDVSHQDLIRLYLRCANSAWDSDDSDARCVATRVCDSLEGFCRRFGADPIIDSVRIAWHLRRVDLLLKQWSNLQDPGTGAEIAAAFQLLSNLSWPEDQADQGEKAAFNAVFWRNQTLALAQQLVQQAIEQLDWPEAMRLLELIMHVSDD